PQGPERVGSSGGPLADAAHGHGPTVVSDLTASTAWAGVGLSTGSAMGASIRTEAGLWAILEVWRRVRDAFTPHDGRLVDNVAAALARKSPAACQVAGGDLPARRHAVSAGRRARPRVFRSQPGARSSRGPRRCAGPRLQR